MRDGTCACPEIDSAHPATGRCIPVLLFAKVNFESVSLFGKAHGLEWYCLSHGLGSGSCSILVGRPLVWKVSVQRCHPAKRGGLVGPAKERQAFLDHCLPHSWTAGRSILRGPARSSISCLRCHEIHRGRGDRCFAVYNECMAVPAACAKMSHR